MAEIDKDKRIKELEEEIMLYKSNGAVGLYYELNRIVNDTIAHTRQQSIKSLLSENEKGDKTFERTMALIKNAKEHVLDIEDMKNKLNLTGNKDKDKEALPFIETVATKRD